RKYRDTFQSHLHGGDVECAEDGTEFELSHPANERLLGMRVNDTTHIRPFLIDLAVNRQLIRYLVLFASVRPFAVEVHPSYGIDRGVAHALLFRTSAAYPHLTSAGNPSADMTQNLINQTFHRQDAARNRDFFTEFFHRISHINFFA